MAFRSRQVAEFLSVRPERVQLWAREGMVKAHKHSDGRHWLFEKEDLAKFILSSANRCQKFLDHKPRKAYQLSYDILHKEVQRQYIKLRKFNT